MVSTAGYDDGNIEVKHRRAFLFFALFLSEVKLLFFFFFLFFLFFYIMRSLFLGTRSFVKR